MRRSKATEKQLQIAIEKDLSFLKKEMLHSRFSEGFYKDKKLDSGVSKQMLQCQRYQKKYSGRNCEK